MHSLHSLHRLTVAIYSPDRGFPVLVHSFVGHTQDEAAQLFESHAAQDSALRTAVAADAVEICWDCCRPSQLVPRTPPHTPPGQPPRTPPGRPPHTPPPRTPPETPKMPPPRGTLPSPRPRAVPLPRPGMRPIAQPARGPLRPIKPGFQAPPIR